MSNSKVFVTVGVDGRNIPAGGEAGQYLKKASSEDYDFAWESPESGGGGTGGTPAVVKSPKDTGDGKLGAGLSYARQDHAHPLNVPTTGLPKQDGTAARGTSDYYAAFDHVHPSDTFVSGLVLDGANIFNSVDDLPAAGTAGRIAFVKIS